MDVKRQYFREYVHLSESEVRDSGLPETFPIGSVIEAIEVVRQRREHFSEQGLFINRSLGITNIDPNTGNRVFFAAEVRLGTLEVQLEELLPEDSLAQ